MSQFDWGTLNPLTESGTQLMTDLNAFRSAVVSSHIGTTRPAYLSSGGIWINNATAPWVVYGCTTASVGGDVVMGYIDPTSLVFTGAPTEGLLVKSVAGASNVTLTSIESNNVLFEFTGVLTGNISVIVPSTTKRYQVENLTTGAFTLTVKTAAGTGIVIPQGTTLGLYCNGTNIEDANSAKAASISPTFIGTVNTPSMNSGQIGGFRNKIINGDMQISQVNGGTAVTPAAGGYIFDQWISTPTAASKLTFQQVTDAPAGFKYSAKITVAAQYAPLATDRFTFITPIEGQNIVDFKLGTSGAVTLAASNFIKSSVAGTYAVCVRNSAANRSYVGTINVTTSWAPVVIVLVGDTGGTWASDNTAGLYWGIDLGSGTNSNTPAANAWQAGDFTRTSGAVTFVNQVAGSTLNITGVQLEKVSAGATQGTEFEHVSYADQLRWCQRYLPRLGGTGTYGLGFAINTTLAYAFIPLRPTRSKITGIITSAPAGFYFSTTTNNIASALAIEPTYTSENTLCVQVTTTGLTAGQIGHTRAINATDYIYGTGSQM